MLIQVLVQVSSGILKKIKWANRQPDHTVCSAAGSEGGNTILKRVKFKRSYLAIENIFIVQNIIIRNKFYFSFS